MGQNGGCDTVEQGELDPHLTQCGQDGGLPAVHAKFHLDPSNRLATVHQRFGQDRTGQTDRQDNGPMT